MNDIDNKTKMVFNYLKRPKTDYALLLYLQNGEALNSLQINFKKLKKFNS